jgi:hypothetical protein
MTIKLSYAMVSGIPEPFKTTQSWNSVNLLGEMDTFWEFRRSDGQSTVTRGKLNCHDLAQKVGRVEFMVESSLRKLLLAPAEIQQMMRQTRVRMDWDGRLLKLEAFCKGEELQARYAPLALHARPIIGLSERAWLDKTALPYVNGSYRSTSCFAGVLDYSGAAVALSHRDFWAEPDQGPGSNFWTAPEELAKWRNAIRQASLTRHQEETLMALEPEWSGSAESLLQAARKL